MDKTSYFFTANCGACHPGGAATQYDRNGNLYFNKSTNLFGYLSGVAALTDPGAKLDGDYGFINPTTGVPGTANWSKTGVMEPDCLMCHMNKYDTTTKTVFDATKNYVTFNNNDMGASWHKRAATARGISVAGVANFESAATLGAGWGQVTYATNVPDGTPPMATAISINYVLGTTAGTLVTDSGNYVIPTGIIGAAGNNNCRGCHTSPDGKKSGRTTTATTDVHNALTCTRCHVTPNTGTTDALGLAMGNPHQIGKGNITIGAVRNDLDKTVKSCAACHIEGGDASAPNPAAAHLDKVPGSHLNFMACQVCHIRFISAGSTTSPTIPEQVIEMTSNGTQNISKLNAYLGTDPLDPTKNLPELASQPFRWYPGLRWWDNKMTTVKPLYTAWFGEWISGEGNAAVIKPIALRLARKGMTDQYAQNFSRMASLPLTPGTQVASGAPILYKKDEIKAALVRMSTVTDSANPSNDKISNRPVLVRADKVYFLNAAGEVEYFESTVAESHDFAINHNVVAKRDQANLAIKPGPYGAGGCTDCHGNNSAFFHGVQLAEPAQYDYLDEAGTVSNPNAGKPDYKPHYKTLGYTEFRAKQLTADIVPTVTRVLGQGSVAVNQGTSSCTTEGSNECVIGAVPASEVTFTATPAPDQSFVKWSGCTPSDTDPLSCVANVGTPASGAENPGIVVIATFTEPAAPTPPPAVATYKLSASSVTVGGTNGGTLGVTSVDVASGSDYFISVRPAAGYTVTAATVDGADALSVVRANGGYPFTNIGAAHSFIVTFTADQAYTLTVGATTNGTVSPGTQSVAKGKSATFYFTPATGYAIQDVKVDGSSVGTPSFFTFADVATNHSLDVTFGNAVTLTTSVTNGSLKVNATPVSGTTTIAAGSKPQIDVAPNAHYKLYRLTVGGVNVTASAVKNADGSYTYTPATAINGNTTVSANCSMIYWALTGTASANGKVGLSSTQVADGGSYFVNITPNSGYMIASVTDNGVDVTSQVANGGYKVLDITSNRAIAATFVAK
ncbi:InlB B-repeat-containing protein [Geomonas agri]|uniref:InlB B-repeat-containing protein n=1 Tax=Geomonas agri TaxID=2873702 RepID=UPI001CD7C4A1|nr:hypothetical protein [Geomonas agri]